MARWIPVSERMPEDGVRVLYFVEKNGYRAVWAGEFLKAFNVWAICQANEKGWASAFVTHWMPLPEPPEFVHRKQRRHRQLRSQPHD